MVASVVRRPACSSGKQVTYGCPQHRKHVGLELRIALKLSSVVTVIILTLIGVGKFAFADTGGQPPRIAQDYYVDVSFGRDVPSPRCSSCVLRSSPCVMRPALRWPVT